MEDCNCINFTDGAIFTQLDHIGAGSPLNIYSVLNHCQAVPNREQLLMLEESSL